MSTNSLGTAGAAVTDPARLVGLAGTPERIGTMLGEINRDVISRAIAADYLERAAAAGITTEMLTARARTYLEIAARVAPHWLEEGRATARAAGVPEDLYLGFSESVVRDRFLHECTSYAVAPEYARDGAILFHKTRDNRDRPQAAYVLASSLPDINSFIAVSDAHAVRCSMVVNDKGLAGAGDYPVDRKKDSSDLKLPAAAPQFAGLMGGTILRYIAERASGCAEALAIIEDFVARGYYAGGEVNANHWLFVDRSGTILEVCNNSRHVVSQYHRQKAYLSRLNRSAAAERLRTAAAPIDFHLFHRVSRDPSICFNSSISGMTVEIDPNSPELLTCAWIALPARTAAFPLLTGQVRTPAAMVDGNAYALGKASSTDVPRWEALEATMHADKERLKQDLAASIDAGNPHEAHVEMLEEWSGRQAKSLLTALGQTG